MARTWLDDRKIERLITSRNRQLNKIKRDTLLFRSALTLLILSTIGTVGALCLNNLADNWFWEKAIIAGFSAILSLGLPSGYLALSINKNWQKKLHLPLSELALAEHLEEILEIQKILKLIRSREPTLFVCEADSEIKSVTKRYWKADCWDIGVFLSMKERVCVSLTDIPPSGEFLLLRSEVKDLILSIPKPTKHTSNIMEVGKISIRYSKISERDTIGAKTNVEAESEKKIPLSLPEYNVNSLTTIVRHPNAFSSVENFDRLLRLIEEKHPKDLLGKRKGLSKGRKTRLRAIQYLDENRKFLVGVISGESINIPKNHPHRKALVGIFSSSARNQNTLGEPGKQLMENFLNRRDSALEKWLEKMGWEIFPD